MFLCVLIEDAEQVVPVCGAEEFRQIAWFKVPEIKRFETSGTSLCLRSSRRLRVFHVLEYRLFLFWSNIGSKQLTAVRGHDLSQDHSSSHLCTLRDSG